MNQANYYYDKPRAYLINALQPLIIFKLYWTPKLLEVPKNMLDIKHLLNSVIQDIQQIFT